MLTKLIITLLINRRHIMKMKQWFKKDKVDVQHFKNQLLFLSVLGGIVLAMVLACELVGRF